MKQRENQAVFISIIFIISTYLFSRGNFSYFFMLVFGFMLMIAFFNEENRLFSWIFLSFFGGNLIRFYLDKFLEGIELNPYYVLIGSQLLTIIPILSVCYVIKAFNREIMSFWQIPSKRMLSFTLIPFPLVFIMITITHGGPNFLQGFLSLLLFAGVHATLQEFIWRGILLTQMIKITNIKYGILITSLAFGINSTLLGFSTMIFISYFLLGLLLGYLTIRTKSIVPAIIAHILALCILFLTGILQIPIL